MTNTNSGTSRAHKAGLFDIRTIIGGLIGVYGVALLLMGIFGSEETRTKAGGLNINLWTGIAMIVFSAIFIAWARLRPIVVPDEVEGGESDARG